VRNWKDLEAYELALHRQDLELGAAFQFASVYAFARLCGSFMVEHSVNLLVQSPRQLSHRPSRESTLEHKQEMDNTDTLWEYKTIIGFVCFLGVWAFVIVGIFRSFCAFCLSGVLVYYQDAQAEPPEFFLVLQHVVSSGFSKVLAALAILCVINMTVICNMKTVKEPLGNANMKFSGTQFLLIAGEVQSRIIDAFTTGKPLYQTAFQYVTLFDKFNVPMSNWNFSIVQARMLHLSLLNLECLCVVMFNFLAWSSPELKRSGILLPERVDRVAPDEAEDSELDTSEDEHLLTETSGEGSPATCESDEDSPSSYRRSDR